MAVTEQDLNLILNAIADPTRRRILHALKEHGGCSIDKGVGLCALGSHTSDMPCGADTPVRRF